MRASNYWERVEVPNRPQSRIIGDSESVDHTPTAPHTVSKDGGWLVLIGQCEILCWICIAKQVAEKVRKIPSDCRSPLLSRYRTVIMLNVRYSGPEVVGSSRNTFGGGMLNGFVESKVQSGAFQNLTMTQI